MAFLDRLVARDGRSNEEDVAAKRIAMLPHSEMMLWLDNVLTMTGRKIHEYLRDGSPDDLEEAKIAARTLNSLIEELERRQP